ncbi:sensor domain-containing diguanylate cyclase [Undibacterium rugosum]|uniref:Diguanylate cyclase n=2 Tax=Undibacterium TaxID=401469 RepID=A0A923HZI1_9BURK|nr:sensor domain-containing diguanylate cyclase [Undibacterium rugosum]MBC3934187.1 diguanylate cyclase [Undibacterium rugosum]MBR7779650.1 diguanylate cyclase [Undibacterium rugosum]
MNILPFGLPVGQKLLRYNLIYTLIAALTTLLCTSLVSTALMQQHMREECLIIARTLASNLSDSIITGDLRGVQNLALNATHDKRLLSVAVFNKEGAAIVAWDKGNLLNPDGMKTTELSTESLVSAQLTTITIRTPVKDSVDVRGYLYVEVSQAALYLHWVLLVLAGLPFALAGAACATYLLTRRQLLTLQPMADLAGVLEKSATLNDYSLRAPADRIRDFGSLHTHCNLMLARMESWESDQHAEARERREMENRISILENHDSLTKLPNRHYFHKLITNCVEEAINNDEMMALMFIDLDQFKTISDKLGYDVCDQVLIAMSERLMEVLRSTDTLCRVGADEFAVILPAVGSLDTVRQLAERLLQALRRPLIMNGSSLLITGSIGISCCPLHAHEQRLFLRNTDLALQAAKAAGRNTWRLYDPNSSLSEGDTTP